MLVARFCPPQLEAGLDGVSMNRRSHWQRVYSTKTSTDVSWFQPEPTVSAELLKASGLQPDT
jgi:hypothetical protein